MSDNLPLLAPLLVFGAHPDDIEFGCGGVVALEARQGRQVHLIVCSRGEAGTMGTPEIREAESHQAAAVLGASLEFIELDGDAHLRSSAQHAITLAGAIRRIRPGVVMAPSLSENQHPDHAQLGCLVRDAARLARFGGVAELNELPPHAIQSLFYYALSLEAEPRDLSAILYDVSDEEALAKWVAAMEAHASQVRAKPYVEAQLTRARLRGLSTGIGHAIALFPADPIVVDRLEDIATELGAFKLLVEAPLRIGIVCYPTIGGSGILATSLGIELALRGHEVHFISYERPARLPLEHHTIRFHPVAIGDHKLFKYPDYTLPLSVKMAEISRAHRLDILHVHYAVPHATAALLALSMLEGSQRPRVVTTLHGTDTTLLGSQPAYGPAIRHALERSDAVTAVSTYLEAETRRLLQITRPIDVIHNFVSPAQPQRSRNEVRSELGVEEREALLIHSSNLRSIKRIDLLLQAASLIKEPFRLLILAGESFAPFESDVRRLGLEDRIIVREKIQNVEDYYSAAEIGVVTSDSESFCLSILEGMFYGCPSVSTRVGGIPEVIRSDDTGLLVAPGDAEALANGITDLITNPERKQAMGQAAKRFAETHFTPEIIVPAYERLYYREVGKPR